MSKNVILKKRNEQIFPITTYENVLNAPEITETISSENDDKLPTSKAVSDYVDNAFSEFDGNVIDSSIHIGDTEPQIKTKLWIDTTDDDLEKVESQSAVIESIQNAIYVLQQKVSKLMLLRTNGVISGSVTDSTLTELGNSAEPVIPAIIADQIEDDNEDTEFPEYAVESEPTVNHVTIKMGTWREISESRRFFVNGELVWCTDRSAMYIYVNGSFKKVASSSTSPDEPIIDDDTMDTQELQEYLDNLDHINFVPVKDPNTKYTVKVNEYGNLVVYNSENDSVLTTPSERGLYFPGYEGIGELMINSFYLGGLDTDEHSYQPCSHNFVELSNISYHDINLNGLCLLYTYNDTTWFKLPLWGVCKAQSTFLIRGAQCSVMDVNTTKIKVKTFDMEWTVLGNDGEYRPIKFDRGNNQAAFYLCWCDLTDNNKIYILDGDENVKANYPNGKTSIIDIDGLKTYAYGYVDLIGVGTSESYYEKKQYSVPGETLTKDMLFVRTYTLDPVTQSNPKAIDKRNNRKYWRHINLDEVIQDGVERFTPKASFENKNLSTDKHNFDPNKPNTITCSFGIQATDNYNGGGRGATRCFNWNSVGYYDEYVWYRKVGTSDWNRVESYKAGVNYSSSGLNRSTDPDCILQGLYEYYTRIRWETFYGAPMTTHKVMIAGLRAGTYEYKIGRADANGNPTDYISKVRTFKVKADSEVTSFDFIQTTDQQGANWEEYQTWDLSADFINRNERQGEIPKVASNATSPGANQNDFDFTVNTGDITYNGSRPNEWIDYYNGYSYIDDKEEMFTVGNNDLSPVPQDLTVSSEPKVYGMTLLGYGRERPDKVSHFVVDLFYTQEMDPSNPPVFEGTSLSSGATKLFRIPSLYSFNYGQFHFVSLNSEIRTGYGDDIQTTVTGEFGVNDVYNGNKSATYDKVEDWLVKDLLLWKNGEIPSNYDRFSPQDCQKAIIYCHEMPFTITAAATYAAHINPGSTTNYARETSKANLNTKHAFQFQRLFKLWGIRLVFGGHKHTCSISMPIYDAPGNFVPYSYQNRQQESEALLVDLTNADTFNPVIQIQKDDNDSNWGIDAKLGRAFGTFSGFRGDIFNSTNTNVTVNIGSGNTVTINGKTTNASSNSKPLCRYEIVDSISAPTYVMCQATGYKNISNSDTSDGEEHCQWQRGMVQGGKIQNDYQVKDVTPTEQLYPFYTRFHVTNNKIYVDMHRVAGMYEPAKGAGYWDVNRDMPNGHEAKMQDLYRYPWLSCEIPLT